MGGSRSGAKPQSVGATLGWLFLLILVLRGVSGSWWIPVAIVVLVGALLIGLAASRTKPVEPVELPPWDWPQDYFDAVGRLGRRIDPMPARLLPIHDNPDIAHIASTAADIAELRTDKPQFWQWALFTSVLLQRREKVRDRLRTCSLGYQPTGDPMRARAYAMLISQLLLDRFELLRQMERFMSSPGFRAAFGYDGDRDDADPDAIVQMANRLMDHHDDLLEQTEVCITLGVETEAVSLAHDAWAYFLHPLVDMDTFMVTLRDRVAQAQELLPYLKGDIELEPAVLDLDPPDGLLDAVSAQTRRLLQPTTGPSAL